MLLPSLLNSKRPECVEITNGNAEAVAFSCNDFFWLHFDRRKGPHKAVHCVAANDGDGLLHYNLEVIALS